MISFLLLTCVLGGGAAWMTGRALAGTWKPIWMAVLYMVPLALAVRFFHFALAHEALLAPLVLITDFAILSAIAVVSFRVSQSALMVRQYPWLYRRTSPVSWAPVDRG